MRCFSRSLISLSMVFCWDDGLTDCLLLPGSLPHRRRGSAGLLNLLNGGHQMSAVAARRRHIGDIQDQFAALLRGDHYLGAAEAIGFTPNIRTCQYA